MSAQTLAHYGHVVGSVVKEFLDKVVPIITAQAEIKLSRQDELIKFFQTLNYQSGRCEAKLSIKLSTIEFISTLKKKIDAFKFQNKDLWTSHRLDPKCFRG